jgi:hypothetical protein
MGTRISRTIPLKDVLTQDKMDGCDSFGGKWMAVIQLKEGTCINLYKGSFFPSGQKPENCMDEKYAKGKGSIIYIHILAYEAALFGDLLAYEAALFGGLLAYEGALFGDLLAYEAALFGVLLAYEAAVLGRLFLQLLWIGR